MRLSDPIDLSLTVKDAKSIEAQWKNPGQNIKDLTASVRYRDTDTVGSPDVTVSGSASFGQALQLLTDLQPNTVYRVETCISKTADSAKCACVATPRTAATKPLGNKSNIPL